MRLYLQKIPLNYLFVLYAFFIPLSLDMLRICAISIILIWLIQPNLKQKLSLIKDNQTLQAIGTLIIILIISLLWTEHTNLAFGIKYITRYWYFLPMLAIYTSIDKRFIPITLSAFLSGMFISELVSYGIFFELLHFDKIHKGDPSPFMQHTLYSVFLSFSAGILLNRLITSEYKIHKLIYALFFMTITANLFLNAGRTGQFLFFAIITTVYLVHYKFSIKPLLSLTALTIVIPYLAFYLSTNFQTRMLQTYNHIKHLSYNTSIGMRIGLDIVAKDIFLENPIVGVGAGDYLSKKDEIVEKKYPERTCVKSLVHYHNQYAEFTVIAGIIGLFSYIFIYISILLIKIQDMRIRTIKYLLVITFMLSSLTDAIFHLNRPMSLFALFVGLLLAYARYEEYTTSTIDTAQK